MLQELQQSDNMNYDEIDDCFPFEEYRPHQKEAIAKIIQYLENGEKNIILNAPVGSGKSVIAYTVARYFQNEYAKSFIFTSTKYLQDQYLDDFKFLKSVKDWKKNSIRKRFNFFKYFR